MLGPPAPSTSVPWTVGCSSKTAVTSEVSEAVAVVSTVCTFALGCASTARSAAWTAAGALSARSCAKDCGVPSEAFREQPVSDDAATAASTVPDHICLRGMNFPTLDHES